MALFNLQAVVAALRAANVTLHPQGELIVGTGRGIPYATLETELLTTMKAFMVTGTTAATNMAVTGILTTSTLLGVNGFTSAAGAPIDITSTCSITSTGNIQCTNSTVGLSLLVIWR